MVVAFYIGVLKGAVSWGDTISLMSGHVFFPPRCFAVCQHLVWEEGAVW